MDVSYFIYLIPTDEDVLFLIFCYYEQCSEHPCVVVFAYLFGKWNCWIKGYCAYILKYDDNYII